MLGKYKMNFISKKKIFFLPQRLNKPEVHPRKTLLYFPEVFLQLQEELAEFLLGWQLQDHYCLKNEVKI